MMLTIFPYRMGRFLIPRGWLPVLLNYLNGFCNAFGLHSLKLAEAKDCSEKKLKCSHPILDAGMNTARFTLIDHDLSLCQ